MIQLERYKSGDLPAEYGTTSLILPPDGTLTYDYPNTTVAVTVRQQEAMILYSIKVSRKQKVVETVPVVVPKKEEEKSYSFQPNWGLAILAAVVCFFIPGPADEGIVIGALFA